MGARPPTKFGSMPAANPSSADRSSVDVVLAGGGVRGIALMGAAETLAEAGYDFKRVAGSSAGAIVGALLAAGLPAGRMAAVMRGLDYRRSADRGALGRLPLIGDGLSILLENGIYEGDYLREWLGNELAALGVETFADLAYDDDGADPTLPADHRYRLVVTVTDVTLGQLLRLPWDYRRAFGRDPNTELVVDAVRASTSVPFLYEPVTLSDLSTGRVSTLVDGGVLLNFPVETFDRRDGRPPRWPTFGVDLVGDSPPGGSALFRPRWLPRLKPVALLESLITTLVVGHDQTVLAEPCVAQRLIRVDTGEVGFADFGLPAAARAELYRAGQSAAASFLARWDWGAYLRGPCGARPVNP